MKKLILIPALLFGLSVQATTITLTEDNTIILDSPVSKESVGEVMEAAKELDSKLKSGYPIYLFLYTPGGSIQAGVELIEFLSALNRPVHTVTLFAASMGFQIIQHMEKRYVARYGVLMSHKARGQFSGEFGGKISQIDTRYGLWLRRIKLMDEQTVKRTNGKQTIKSYTSAYNPELWLNGEEAVKEGYADEVVKIKCDDSLSGVRETVEDAGFFSVKVLKSACPMQTGIVGVVKQIVTNRGIMELGEFLKNNGQFGECQASESNGLSTPIPTLCAKDPTLNLEKINAKSKEIKEQYSKDPKDNIIYSY